MGKSDLTLSRMLLRLRQLTAHVLMLQLVMRDLLEREDIEVSPNASKLLRLTNIELAHPRSSQRSGGRLKD